MENFHLVVNDDDAMFITDLARGHEEIHVYVEHPVDDPILVDEGDDIGEGLVIEEVNEDDSIEIDASQVGSRVGSRRVGKEPIIKHPPEVFHVSDSSGSGGSGLDDEAKVNPSLRDFVEDNSES
nr:hypothetical protein CFP56_62812 [Quercus suber]